jgi:hypothetical protein
MDGLELCARYSFRPNSLKYCGPKDADKVLYDFITKRSVPERDVERVLEKFEALYPYLETIAKSNGKKPFDDEVVEAYWLGNDLLEKVSHAEMKDLIKKLAKRGLPKSIAEQLAERLPRTAVPHHSFHVLYIGVGAVTNSVPNTLENADRCRISAACVNRVNKDSLDVQYNPLIVKDKKLVLDRLKEKEVIWDSKFLPDVGINNTIAVHWDFAVQILNGDRIRNLKKYTAMNIKAINTLR